MVAWLICTVYQSERAYSESAQTILQALNKMSAILRTEKNTLKQTDKDKTAGTQTEGLNDRRSQRQAAHRKTDTKKDFI